MAINPVLVVLPVGVGIAAWFLLKPSSSTNPAYTPPPGTPTAQSGGTRYQNYMQQLQAASLAYTAGSLFDKSDTSAAAQTLKGTLDVVAGMAVNDQKAGNITAQDLANINNQINVLKTQIGK